MELCSVQHPVIRQRCTYIWEGLGSSGCCWDKRWFWFGRCCLAVNGRLQCVCFLLTFSMLYPASFLHPLLLLSVTSALLQGSTHIMWCAAMCFTTSCQLVMTSGRIIMMGIYQSFPAAGYRKLLHQRMRLATAHSSEWGVIPHALLWYAALLCVLLDQRWTTWAVKM